MQVSLYMRFSKKASFTIYTIVGNYNFQMLKPDLTVSHSSILHLCLVDQCRIQCTLGITVFLEEKALTPHKSRQLQLCAR